MELAGVSGFRHGILIEELLVDGPHGVDVHEKVGVDGLCLEFGRAYWAVPFWRSFWRLWPVWHHKLEPRLDPRRQRHGPQLYLTLS